MNTLHINFRGNAREALEYYHSIFGGDIIAVPYGDVAAGQDAEQADQLSWGQVVAGACGMRSQSGRPSKNPSALRSSPRSTAS